jgi:hypothetical protein
MPPLLLILLIAWAALLFGGFILGKPQAGREGRMPTWTRVGSTFALMVAGWSWFAMARDTSAASYATLIAIGITFGFVADLIMARLLRLSPRVLWGMLVFGLGHIAYIAAILGYGNAHGLDAAGPRFGAWLAWLLIGAVAWYFVMLRGHRPTALHWASLPYALLLASTAGFASGLALQNAAFVPLAIGAVLFLVSDLILAAHVFAGRTFRLVDDVIWLTYGPGQMLIVTSVGAAIMAA